MDTEVQTRLGCLLGIGVLEDIWVEATEAVDRNYTLGSYAVERLTEIMVEAMADGGGLCGDPFEVLPADGTTLEELHQREFRRLVNNVMTVPECLSDQMFMVLIGDEMCDVQWVWTVA